MALLKSVSRLLANTIMIPIDGIRDIASIGDENKTHSALVERSKRWANSATEIGEVVVDASKVGGKKVLEVSKEVGLGLSEVGRTIQNIADGKDAPKPNQEEHVRVETKPEVETEHKEQS